MDGIYKYSVGTARKINKICSHCLINAVQKGKKLIDGHMVKTIVDHEMP
jgi:hypothetical protein